MTLQKESCPWCGSLISREKYEEIEYLIRAEGQQRLAEAESEMKIRLEEHNARELESEKHRLRTAAQHAMRLQLEQVEQDRMALCEQITALTKERDQSCAQLAQSEEREAAIRMQLKEEVAQAVKADQ